MSRVRESADVSVLTSKVPAVSTHTDTTSEPAALRSEMVARLLARGSIESEEIRRAFEAVPRHLFAPEAGLDTAYDEDSVVRTKFGPDGTCLSSVSAPHAQALMLKALGVRAGDRVVEYGSGGYNAALLAEVAGLTGQVTTVDIDEDVTDRAARFLEHAGYSRVRVTLADAEGGVDGGPFERSLVTFGAWDIPLAWARQMADGGVLTVPLRMAGLTRVVSFVRDGELLVSTDHEMFGFVPFPVKSMCSACQIVRHQAGQGSHAHTPARRGRNSRPGEFGTKSTARCAASSGPGRDRPYPHRDRDGVP